MIDPHGSGGSTPPRGGLQPAPAGDHAQPSRVEVAELDFGEDSAYVLLRADEHVGGAVDVLLRADEHVGGAVDADGALRVEMARWAPELEPA